MIKRVALGFMIVAASPNTAIAKSSAPETLTRSGNWIVDYDRDACHLFAEFGSGEVPVTLATTRGGETRTTVAALLPGAFTDRDMA